MCGVLGQHVDDSILGGRGAKWANAISLLRKRFPFRKWLEGGGDVTGSVLKQLEDFSIVQSQSAYADGMDKVATRRSASTDAIAIPGEVKSFVSMNQKGHWLATQTRPDLSILVSTSQQKMPSPTVGNIRQGNMLGRRAQQYSELTLTYHSIPCDQLSFLLHTDYLSTESSNMGHTQGGYIVGTTNKDMEKGLRAPWAPAVWRSYRVRRVVNSTLSGESSCLIDGLGHLEWLLSFFAVGFSRGFTLEIGTAA